MTKQQRKEFLEILNMLYKEEEEEQLRKLDI